MPTRYLKNAWVKKDADGNYWLYIQAADLQSMFCLYESVNDEVDRNSTVRRTLDDWLTDQDSTNGDATTAVK
jgi:hypothetical protein